MGGEDRDEAYSLYKAGMRLYSAIEPDAPDLELLFAGAYESFSSVATGHPGSIWAADARDKLELLERRARGYRRMAESAGAWKRAGSERSREVEEIVKRTKESLRAEGELKWPE
jgi:hypothetical protein